jgi:hypothetical protein
MRWLPPLYDQLVTFSFSRDFITCGLIRAQKAQSRYALYAYRKIPVQLSGRPSSFYSASVLKELEQFITRYKAAYSFAACALDASLVVQGLCTFATAHPTVDEYKKQCVLPDGKLQSIYLYPTENGYFTFYVAAVDHALLLQYQLLALRLHLNVLTITTQFQTLLTLYRYIQGCAFRQIQLARDMQQYQNRLERFFNVQIIHRMVDVSSANRIHGTQEFQDLLPLLGLYIGQEDCTWTK